MSLDKTQALNAAKQYVLQQNLQAAVEEYRKIIDDDPSDLTSINTLGDLYASDGRTQEAIAQFSRVAAAYTEGGFTRKAIATLKKLIALDPGNIETAIKLADVFAQAGLPSEARQHYLQIAEALTRKGRTLEALTLYRKAVDLDPSNTSTRIKLGELYLREGMNEQAFDAFITAAEQLAGKSENRRALNAYNEALAIRPDSLEAQAAARRVLTALGAPDPDKNLRVVGSPNVEKERAKQQRVSSTSGSPDPSGPLDQSDGFVIQEISKAEILVAYGQVSQAVAMLRDVLINRPDSIDVHVKLKDIYLRTGMMAEAARECVELERIHDARGESERARDYAVRASRLTQFLEHPSGDLPQPARKHVQPGDLPQPAPKPVQSGNLPRPALKLVESGDLSQPARKPVQSGDPPQPARKPVQSGDLPQPARKPVASGDLPQPARKPVQSGDLPQPARKPVEEVERRVDSAPVKVVPVDPPQPRPARTLEASPAQPNLMTISVIAEDAPPIELPMIPSAEPPASQSSSFDLAPVAAMKLEKAPSNETALTLSSRVSSETALALPALFASATPVKKRRGRLTVAAAAAAVFAVLGVGATLGGFAYDNHLDKQYQELALAAPPVEFPLPAPVLASEESPAQENEPITVVVTPSAQPDTPAQKQSAAPSEQIRNEPPSAPPPVNEAPKVATKPSPVLPRTAVGVDNRAGAENGLPVGVPMSVPVGAANPAEPPPRAVRQSPGVVTGGALKKVDPIYPAAARDARQGGSVTVEVTISDQGNVTSARALSGPTLLQNAAVMAARAWKFKPSTLGGVPVTTTTTIVFNFKL